MLRLIFWLCTALSLTVPLWAENRAQSPSELRPGSLLEFLVEDGSATRVEIRTLDSDELVASFPVWKAVGGNGVAWGALDFDRKPGPVVVRWLKGRELVAQRTSRIVSRDYVHETISLSEAMSSLRDAPNPRRDREAQQIWSIYRNLDTSQIPSDERFGLPVDPQTRQSAQFGDHRLYVYSDGGTATDIHRGVDFAVAIGTPVVAPASGLVVLSQDRYLTGGTLVLEHGPGLYSVYFHLSRRLVTEGVSVSQGQKIALSGASGLVTGPHLHWEVRTGGVPVDPLLLVGTRLLDTSRAFQLESSINRIIP